MTAELKTGHPVVEDSALNVLVALIVAGASFQHRTIRPLETKVPH